MTRGERGDTILTRGDQSERSDTIINRGEEGTFMGRARNDTQTTFMDNAEVKTVD